MEYYKTRPSSLIARYACSGALPGLLLGLLEATQVSRYSHTSTLLKPSVRYVVWFLAPLLDATVTGFLGFVAGLAVAAGQRNRTWRRIAQAIGAHWVVEAALAICFALLLAAKGLMGSSSAFRILAKVAVILLVVSTAFLLGRRLRLKTLGVTLSGIFALLLAGVGFYFFRPSLQATAAAAGPESVSRKPNIILISLDTVRADHLSVYGYPRPTTSNLQKWARRGVVFENAIAPSSWTLTSHASTFTGLLPHQHGADWAHPFDTSRWTLAEALTFWGYETAGFTSNLWYGEAGWGMDQGFGLYDDDSTSIRHNLRALLVGGRLLEPLYYHLARPDFFDRRGAREINHDVLRWLQRRSRRPFFLFINYFDVHDPYLVPPHDARRFGDAPAELIEKTRPAFEGSASTRVSPQDRAALIAGYDNCLASLDDSMGELLDSLSRLPRWDNTVVIISSDHGEGFGEHGTYSHGLSLYREVLHVPLIIFGPQIPGVLRVSHLVPTQELFSTVLEFAGGDAAVFQRTTLRRYWTPGFRPGEFDDLVVSELMPKFRSAGLSPSISLTTPEWQYIRNARGEEELYRLSSDRTEQANLANSTEYQRVLAELHARLKAVVNESRPPWRRPQYLSALDGPGRIFIPSTSADPELGPGSLQPNPRIGDAQAHFPPKASISSRRPQSPDEDLLRSLPYH